MAVVRAQIQTVEEIYKLVWTAVANKWPMEASYQGRHRLFCPHRLGRNKEGRLRVLCYQYGGESQSGLQASGSPTNWRCIALEKLSGVSLVEGAWRTAPNHSRPGSCVADADIDLIGVGRRERVRIQRDSLPRRLRHTTQVLGVVYPRQHLSRHLRGS